MRYITVCLCLCFLLSASGTSVRDSWDPADLELFAAALAQVGLSPEEMRFDVHDREFYGGDKYSLPFFDALIDDPLKISPYTRRLTDELLADADDLGLTLSRLQSRADYGVRVGLTGDPLAEYREQAEEQGEHALASAIGLFHPDVESTALIENGYGSLPQEIQLAAAVLLLAMNDALMYQRLAIAEPLQELGLDADEVSMSQTWNLLEDVELSPAEELHQLLETEELLGAIDFGLLNTGATLLAIAVDAVADELAALVPTEEFSFFCSTPFGMIHIDSRSHTEQFIYSQMPYLLVLDFSGTDAYHGGGAVIQASAPVSVVIDLNGDDEYRNTGTGFGSGVFGYGMLVDTQGNDYYDSEHLGLGAGLFGVGILCDWEGNDTYSGEVAVQGSGTYGTGMLIDLAGDDVYECYQYGQGYGFTKGCGLLLDAAGNDKYVANDTDIKYASPQSAEHNASLSQGFGFGRRGDYNDGHSWAGGVGMLVDGGGDDSYSCGVFGQGCAYWYGVGILADKAGDDSYFGQWYCQGSGAHFALGVLQDDAGDDRYVGAMNMCVGAGHDFSLGWLEDGAGDDRYDCPNLSLGAANANGIGVFWDKAGDDNYLSRGVTLGMANSVRPGSLRDYMLSLGVFIDGGGSDTYLQAMGEGEEPAEWDFAGDGLAWSRSGGADPPLKAEKGCAVDAE